MTGKTVLPKEMREIKERKAAVVDLRKAVDKLAKRKDDLVKQNRLLNAQIGILREILGSKK